MQARVIVKCVAVIVIIVSFIILLKVKVDNPYNCPPPGAIILSVAPGGRLGNLVWEYLSLWGVARKYKGRLWPAAPATLMQSLSKIFIDLKIPVLEDLQDNCGVPKIDLQKVQQLSAYEISQTISDAIAGDVIVLRKYSISREVLLDCVPEAKNELHFKPELQAVAQATLQNARITVFAKLQIDGLNISSPEDLGPFVGVHVRRTDYIQHLNARRPDVSPAGPDYFLSAINDMRIRLKHLYPGCHPVFVAASDDIAWCKNYLEPHVNDLVVSGTGDILSPGHDLATLAACNHTIFAYGTYGLTAAVFAGGHTIMYLGGKKKHKGQSYKYFEPNRILEF